MKYKIKSSLLWQALWFPLTVSAQSAADYLSPDSLKYSVAFLSSDSLRGRANFTPHLEKAALFIARQYEQAGLTPLQCCENYLQPFVVSNTRERIEEVRLNGVQLSEKQYYYTSNSLIPAELTAGDFKVIPLNTDSSTSSLLAYINQCIDSTTLPLLLVLPAGKKDLLNKITHHSTQLHPPAGPVLIVLTNEKAPRVQLRMNPSVRKKMLFNVVGLLPGKEKADEVVIISSHYDHVGVDKSSTDSIFNGSNDNASGTACMISLAKYFATKNDNARTLLFVAFAGEEIGLRGSSYLAANLKIANVKAMFNLEMLGKPGREGKSTVMVTENAEVSALHRIMSKYCPTIKILSDAYPSERLFTRSDNYPFSLLGAAAHTFMCFSPNDPTYHEAGDELQTLDIENMSVLVKGLLPGIEAVVAGKETPNN